MYIRLKIAVCAILLSATMFSCTKEEMVAEPLRKGPEIGFGVNLGWEADKIGTKSGYGSISEYGRKQGKFALRSSESADTLAVGVYVQDGINISESPITKGSVISNVNDLENFSAYCKLTNNDGDAISYFSNIPVSKTGDNIWSPATSYYWPGSDYTSLEFLAVAPHNSGLAYDNTSLMPASFTYQVPDNPAEQRDIMIAKPKYTDNNVNFPGNYTNSVPLDFEHILTCIQFACTDFPEGGIIQSVSLSGNMITEGEYTIADGLWSNTAAKSVTYSTTLNDKLLLLPQTVGTDAITLTVSFLDNGETTPRTLTAAIPAITWDKSKTYTYSFSISDAYVLEFLSTNNTTLDAHYIITTLQFKTDVNWTLSVPESAKSWAYLSKQKSNSGTDTENKANEITANQMAGMWTYVEKCNKQSINGTVANEGTEEIVTVYMLLRENANEADRNLSLILSKTGETKTKLQSFKQLGYKVYDNSFGMERIEDVTSPYGFAKDLGTVTYKCKWNSIFSAGWDNLIPYIICKLSNFGNSIWTGPADININLSTDVSGIISDDRGIDNTKESIGVGPSISDNYLIAQGWYVTTAYITPDDTKVAMQSCIAKNNYGEYTGDNDDTNADITADKIVWYLPAINELLKITTQDAAPGHVFTGATIPYWSSTAIDDNKNAYSWYYGATAGSSTARSTTLKIRCARVVSTATN